MTFLRSIFIFFASLIFCSNAQCQVHILERYAFALEQLESELKSPSDRGFKKSVFIVEKAFLGDSIKQNEFDSEIAILTYLSNNYLRANPQADYRFNDSLNFKKNFALYKLLSDSILIEFPDGRKGHTRPYTYDFSDFFGREDWSNMFVSKLFRTHKGNCHSLPYLYKILADELNAQCWLSFAPNHIYIKNRCQKAGWYNTELTSGSFPVDAWIATSGYVPIEAIRNGIYMDTLSNQQAVAQCILDLAKGYEFKTKNYQDDFILKCCDLVLQYHPVNVQALLLKAETLKQVYEANKSKAIYKDMEATYIRLLELGYREMPERMYMQWLKSAIEQRDKFSNKQLN